MLAYLYRIHACIKHRVHTRYACFPSGSSSLLWYSNLHYSAPTLILISLASVLVVVVAVLVSNNSVDGGGGGLMQVQLVLH